jgi:hypothetical protein
MGAMEAALPERPAARRKRVAAPRPSNAVVAAREQLWARYLELEMEFGHRRVKLTKLAFAVRHHQNPDEFVRWFSATDRRGIPQNSDPDRHFRQALTDAIAELEARAGEISGHHVQKPSHGNRLSSQFSAARFE